MISLQNKADIVHGDMHLGGRLRHWADLRGFGHAHLQGDLRQLRPGALVRVVSETAVETLRHKEAA